MPKQTDNQTDYLRFIRVLNEIGIPFESHEDGKLADVTLNASASDKHVTFTFLDGDYQYSN